MDENKVLQFVEGLKAAGGCRNMWELGQELGLDRNDTETLAMNLVGQGLLEIVNLTGMVQLTEAGRLSAGSEEPGSDDLDSLLYDLGACGDLDLDAAAAADLAVDLATLEAHLKRSRPLPQVVKACLEAMQESLQKAESPQAAALLQRLDRAAAGA